MCTSSCNIQMSLSNVFPRSSKFTNCPLNTKRIHGYRFLENEKLNNLNIILTVYTWQSCFNDSKLLSQQVVFWEIRRSCVLKVLSWRASWKITVREVDIIIIPVKEPEGKNSKNQLLMPRLTVQLRSVSIQRKTRGTVILRALDGTNC